MSTYIFIEDGGEYESVEADSLEEAVEMARDSFDPNVYQNESETIWCDIYVRNKDDGEDSVMITITVDPPEPECEENHKHEWTSPQWLGGCDDNPGVWGNGGGVIITEVCEHCGCGRITDTWTQRQDTGEQGLRSVEYDVDYTADNKPDEEE